MKWNYYEILTILHFIVAQFKIWYKPYRNEEKPV